MRVVLDTNILFSALISPHGAPDTIYRVWRAARFESDADFMVTGDRRAGLLQLRHIERTRIVTPAVFCAEVL